MLPDQYNPETDPQEAARTVGAMLRTGTVAEVDVQRALVRFKTGGITTDWLPWFERRAGGPQGGRSWWPPVEGEQGLLLAPGGDLARAIVLPGMFSNAMPQGAAEAGTAREDWNTTDYWQWKNGTLDVHSTQKIELAVGAATITITPDAIRLQAGGASVELAGGIVTAEGDVISGSISLRTHKHTGVIPGPALTGEPTP